MTDHVPSFSRVSDEECLATLEAVIQRHDDEELAEITRLI
jgi:hypothetical protein